MLNLVLAILSSSCVSIFMRLSKKYIRNNFSMLAMNYVVCTAMSICFLSGGVFPNAPGLSTAIGLGAISGVFYLAGFLLLQWSVEKNGVTLSSTFMKLGVLVPTVLSVTLFHEKLRLMQGIGLVLALAAILIIHFESGKSHASNSAGLMLLLLSGGMADAMSKFYEQYGNPALEDQYLSYTFGVALILCLILIVIRRQKITWREAAFGLLIGIPNYFSARFLLLSLGSVPAVIAFPSFCVATIVVVSAAGMLLFRERISRRQGVAMGIILVALVLLNI